MCQIPSNEQVMTKLGHYLESDADSQGKKSCMRVFCVSVAERQQKTALMI